MYKEALKEKGLMVIKYDYGQVEEFDIEGRSKALFGLECWTIITTIDL